MDLFKGFEIYIPQKAEVRSIPVWSLSKSILKRMDLPQAECEGSTNLAVWICPAIVRKSGQPLASPAAHSVRESASSLWSRKPPTTQGPFEMSFETPNYTAYRLLQGTIPGRMVAARTSQSSRISDSPPPTHQDAVVIYRGRAYVFLRKIRSRHGNNVTRHQPTSLLSDSLCPATSASASESQNMDDCVPQTTEDMETDSLCQETVGRVVEGEQEEVMPTGGGDSGMEDVGSEEAPSADPHGDRANSDEDEEVVVVSSDMEDLYCEDAPSADRHGDRASCDEDEDALVVSSDMEGLCCEDAPRADPHGDRASSDEDEAVGEDRESLDLTITSTPAPHHRGVLQGLPVSSTPAPQHYDFEQLAQEERINQIRAKLRVHEAVLNNMQPGE